ncbi:MAG: isoprenylcysteine carboxylmethyltransferase family protein [Phycisphaerales bacterium]|nr:MAG: isoprenylcysteine carboxylmethyltransferase family protein [Phycisphaerales bacterium]
MAWLIGSVSLVAFFVPFLFAGSLNLVDLALGETAKLAWDVLLCLVFFLQHSGMIRRSYRQWSGRFIPQQYDGATYTIASGVALLLLVVLWQESAHILAAPGGILRWLLRTIYFLSIAGFAWGMLALGSFDAFGVRPIIDRLRGTESPPMPFTLRGPYRWVRHPLYSFSLLMIWACPDLTADRLLFNVLWTVWIIVGTVLEERDLVSAFGETYRDYQGKVPMLIPHNLRPTAC